MKFLKLIAFGLFFTSNLAFGEEDLNTSSIKHIVFYSTASSRDGEIVIQLEKETENCQQYWISAKDSLGYRNTISSALSAYHAQSEVLIGADPSSLWTGSGVYDTCEIIHFRVL
ncbi:hypothetical protein BTJ40_14450 [Microbulbifer sp. A4B17]|uniref:hypothetical protein n=1 Tax=Microbulbifer sp. A4B17 TaxID=359370 RepID=UPI000D52BDC7|nr:hypothetical protein [Microbulbifer sp. A4B17]AWF81929.1 hypothetical protein BTJ40_14450 [Microbulbifer sp. A4B17]